MPPFRGQKRSGCRTAFIRFKTIDDARVGLRMLDGRMGPGGETLSVRLSRAPAVDPNEMWRWVCETEVMEEHGGSEGGVELLSDEWEGLGFGTGVE